MRARRKAFIPLSPPHPVPQPDDNDHVAALIGPAERRLLVAAGIRAPSGDNCQPWHFRFAGNRLDIFLLRDRAASFFDFRHRGSFISIGAVIENVRVQAACMGFGASVSYASGEVEDETPIARVLFRTGPAADERCRARLAALQGRSVNRRPFLPVRIDPGKQREWLADPVEGTETTLIENRREIVRWARVTYLGDRIRWTHPVIHRELFANIRFSRAEAETSRMGLEIDRLGAGPLAVPVMRLLQSWPRMQRLARFGVDAALANQTRALAFCAGALVLVTIETDSIEHWVRAGEQVERLWIIAEQQGLCVQPVPVALYLDQRYLDEGAVNFEADHRTMLADVRHALGQLLGDRVGAMLYRVGYGWRMSRPAVRQSEDLFFDHAPSDPP